jgi:hypothetical protein
MFFPQGHSASRMFVSRSFGVDYSLGGVESFITSKCHNNHGKRECRSPEESVFFFGELHLRKSHARLDRMAPAGWRSLYRQQGRFEDWQALLLRANKKLQQALSDSHGKRHTLLDCLADFAQGKAWYVIFLAFMYANRSHVSSSLALWLRDGPFQLVVFAPK